MCDGGCEAVGCRAKIPGFGTEQEMREFWDAHDSAEYFEDMNDDGVQITFKQDGGIRVLPLGMGCRVNNNRDNCKT